MSSLGMRLSSGVQEYQPEIWNVLYNMLYVRMVITVLLVGWGAWISWQYNRTVDPVKQEQIKYTNFIWAGSGKTGVFMSLFWIWILTIIAVSAYPLIAKLVPDFFQH